MKKNITQILKESTSSIPLFEARLLIAHVVKKSRELLITHPEYKLSKLQNWKIKRLIKKRTQGIPLAYLMGHKEFFGLDFLVNKHTLVPRPETEVLVEEVLKKLPPKTTLIDVGTGTGCIPISILKSRDHRSEIAAFATDISDKALTIAQKNAQKHTANITFLHGNLLEPILKSCELQTIGHELIITANLPYLTQKQFDEEVSIQHEPHSALVAEDNGLALYKNLLNQIQFLISNFQFRISAFFEIDPSQSLPLSKHVHNLFPNPEIKIIKDGMGNDRVIHIIIDKSTHS